MKKMIVLFLSTIFFVTSLADSKDNVKALNSVKTRCRVIVDNDFSGDPDGLFQLVHQILSNSCEIRGIIGSHLRKGDGFDNSNVTAANAKKEVEKILEIMNLKSKIPVYQGSNVALENVNTAIDSDGSDFIIKEALREDKRPLYIVAGAGLTEIANAYLKNPKISKKFTLIWIGGQEYDGLAYPPPGFSNPEYNLNIDIKAGQVIFNKSDINIWQVPRNAYRQTLMSYSELQNKVNSKGKLGEYLTSRIMNVKKLTDNLNILTGETYIMGDSPLVLLSELQSSFEADPSSSEYTLRKAPIITDSGMYQENSKGRQIRVYNKLDVRLMFEDFYNKLDIYNKK